MTAIASAYVSKRDPRVKAQFAIFMGAAIAALGWVMMTISSSPTVKGASFLWLPAALQLAVGVWLGPGWGFLAAGFGAYLSGILNYGGWGPLDLTQNLVAGGFANAMLPALLFRALRVDPTLGANKPGDVLKGSIWLVVIGFAAMLVGNLGLTGLMAFVPPLLVILVGAFFLLRGLTLDGRSLILAVIIAVVSCAASAFIGALGAFWFAGKPSLMVALADPGIGWFAGDTVSAILGLYLLAMYTPFLKTKGVAD